MFNKRNLFSAGGAAVLIIATLFGIKILNREGNDTEQDRKESTPAELPTKIPVETSSNKRDENPEGSSTNQHKNNSVSSYEIVDDPFGGDNECLQVGVNTPENPQTAFGVVRAIGDPETFDVKVDLLFKDGQGGYIKVETFEAGEIPGSEWRIIQPGTRGCER